MPNTREKLIELMCNAKYEVDSICVSRDWCDGCPAEYGKGSCKEVYVADQLIANGVTVQQWISVKDRLPEANVAVLVYDGKNVDGFTFYDLSYVSKYGVTHWMPLPEAPKGE